MTELFDKKYVHFMWDKAFEEAQKQWGNKGVFLADTVTELRESVNAGHSPTHMLCDIQPSGDVAYPFTSGVAPYKFLYCDPDYELKQPSVDLLLKLKQMGREESVALFDYDFWGRIFEYIAANNHLLERLLDYVSPDEVLDAMGTTRLFDETDVDSFMSTKDPIEVKEWVMDYLRNTL